MTKFWKPLLAIALICALALAGLGLAAQSPAAAAQAERADEFRAVWVATVYRLDYPSQATTDPAVLKRDADAILQGCVDMGMNAVILQVRPSADALYPSELYPWSKYLTGAQGTAPKNGFDPLAYWVERAHALGLELHAWVNPFRITKGGAAEFQALTADHPAKLHPDWVVEYEGDYYFNPGLPEVREYIVRGAEELARKYDIDGIHLDDYFYPGSGFADGAAYAKYGKGFSNIGDWRRDNVNQLVKTLGERIHAIDPGLSYGISPSGVWADKSSLPQVAGEAHFRYRLMAENPELLALYAEAYGEESQEPAEPAYLNTREHDAYIQGNDGRFRPEDSLSRAEAVAMLARLSVDEQGNLLYSGAPGTGGFSDVKRGDWYAPYVAFAKRYGIANGYLDGTFRPEQPVSRAELVKLIASYFTVEGGTSPFPDVPDGHWAAEVVSFAAEEGWVSGYPDGTFRPDAPVSRAEAVKILNHALDRRAGERAAALPFTDVEKGHWACDEIREAAVSHIYRKSGEGETWLTYER